MVSFLASIPSPSQNEISIGPIDLRAYGFLIALGVLAGVWLASRRFAQDGYDPEVIPNMALWVLPAAIIGARAYFVLTNWGRFSDDIASAFRIWEGGLGIPGGVALGGLVGVLWLRRNEVPLPPVFTAVALGLPLGQIIGRFGNWFNQELYGRPTDLPWGLEIDAAHRLPGYEANELFHPTFAYEIIWNIGLLAFLIWLDRKRVLRPGALFAYYLIGYGIGRILIETVRIDPVNEFLGVRLHIWAMVAFVIGALIYLRRRDWGRLDEADRAVIDLDEADDEPLGGGGTATKTRAKAGTKADKKAKTETKDKAKAETAADDDADTEADQDTKTAKGKKREAKPATGKKAEAKADDAAADEDKDETESASKATAKADADTEAETDADDESSAKTAIDPVTGDVKDDEDDE